MKRALIAASLLASLSISAHAADMNSIAKATSELSAKITQFQKADFITQTTSIGENQPRSLRHLYLQTYTNAELIKKFRFINGVKNEPLPPLVAKEWNMEDVENLIKIQIEDLKQVEVIYNLDDSSQTSSNTEAKVDALFKAQLAIQEQIKSLGIPGQDPGHSYQYAQMISTLVGIIAYKLGVELPPPNSDKVTDKRPNDSYLYALSVAAELQYYLTEYLKQDIPGGVVVPTALNRPATSDDTIAVMKTIIADLVALKTALGDTTPIRLPAYQEGRTPSDVYSSLVRAYDMIFALEDAAAS